MNTPLIEYALAGLDRCWLEDECRWSHIYHLDGRTHPNESVPHSDVCYTLKRLVGLARAAKVPEHIDVPAIFDKNAQCLIDLPVPRYALGTALWAGAELELDLPVGVLGHIRRLLCDRNQWRRFTA